MSSVKKKRCELCGKWFQPHREGRGRFCGTSCAAKWRMAQPEIREKINRNNYDKKSIAHRAKLMKVWWATHPDAQKLKQRMKDNPISQMHDPKIRAKVSKRLKEIGHRPRVRGGNGHGLTKPQAKLWKALGKGFTTEHYVGTELPRVKGNVPFYLIDIANVTMKLAIEVDGLSHSSIRQKKRDVAKDKFLKGKGWRVLRFTNREILDSVSTVVEVIRSSYMTCK